MPRVSPEVLRSVEQALREYEGVVEHAGLEANTAKTYLLHSRNFVRWLRGEFTPGRTLSMRSGRAREGTSKAP